MVLREKLNEMRYMPIRKYHTPIHVERRRDMKLSDKAEGSTLIELVMVILIQVTPFLIQQVLLSDR